MLVSHNTKIELSTGTLELVIEHAAELDAFCDFAARANPKRGFLIVSKVLGRHLPASPNAMRGAMDELGQKLPADLPGPIVFLGMAETATRSEEHTSELQSLMRTSYAVFCLNKKNTLSMSLQIES